MKEAGKCGKCGEQSNDIREVSHQNDMKTCESCALKIFQEQREKQ